MHTIDVTLQNFASAVVQASQQRPILVDFWAPWCGPCRSLMPVLNKLAEEYQGAFTLAKINIDEQQPIAAQFGVRSVPTVKLVKNGQVVDEFTGAIPETQIRMLLDKHIQRESDALMLQAYNRYLEGEAEALQTMIEIANSDTANHKLRLLLVDALVKENKFDEAKAVIATLPEELRNNPEIVGLLNRMQLMEASHDLADMETLQQRVNTNPADLEARQQLSTHYVLQADYEAALEQLLEIMRRDRRFGDDAGRKGILKIFEMLGGSGELVSRYRQKLASLLY